MGRWNPRQSQHLSACGALCRQYDAERFLCALQAPAEVREDLFALQAFYLELAKTREVVSEHIVGQIRLQWWRDTLEGVFGGAPRQHEVAQALDRAIRARGLRKSELLAVIDAIERDLEAMQPRDLEGLERHVEQTAGALSTLWLACLADAHGAVRSSGDTADAVRHASLGWGLVGILRATPYHARSRLTHLPVAEMERAGAAYSDLFEGRFTKEIADVVQALACRADWHLTRARSLRGGVEDYAIPVLQLATFGWHSLRRLRRRGFDPFSAQQLRPSAGAVARVGINVLLGRY